MAVQWGLLDSDMPAKIGGSFQQGQRNALAMQGAQQGQQMNAMKMQQAQQEMAGQNALNRAFQESGGDIGKARAALMQGGQYKPAMELSKIESDQRKSEIMANKADLEDKINKIQLVSQILSSSHDQASHEQNLQEIASILGPELTKNIPSVYNPAELQFIIKKGESIKDQKYNELQQHNQELRQQEIEAMGGYRQAQLDQGEERLAQGARQIGMQEQAALAKTTKGATGGINTEQRMQDAQDVLGILAEAAPLIDKATSSYLGKGISEAARTFGASTEAADAAASLATLQASLISKMPKMSGPQSDKDVLLYREMAGKIGDPTVPASQKKAAMNEIAKINARYAGVEVPVLNYGKQPKQEAETPSDWSEEEEAAYRAKYGD